jgi:hypothetical protein
MPVAVYAKSGVTVAHWVLTPFFLPGVARSELGVEHCLFEVVVLEVGGHTENRAFVVTPDALRGKRS